MVATFLESMDSDDAEAAEYLADFGRPSWSEVASVAALAVRLRLGAADAPLRSGARGEALRLVALMGLLVHAAAATIEAGSRLWLGGRVDWLAAPPGDWAPFLPHSAWPTISTIAGLLWLPAYVGLLLGHRRAAQLLAFLALLPARPRRASPPTRRAARPPSWRPRWRGSRTAPPARSSCSRWPPTGSSGHVSGWPARYPTGLGPNPARAWETPTQSTCGTLFRLRVGCSASIWTAPDGSSLLTLRPRRSRRIQTGPVRSCG